MILMIGAATAGCRLPLPHKVPSARLCGRVNPCFHVNDVILYHHTRANLRSAARGVLHHLMRLVLLRGINSSLHVGIVTRYSAIVLYL